MTDQIQTPDPAAVRTLFDRAGEAGDQRLVAACAVALRTDRYYEGAHPDTLVERAHAIAIVVAALHGEREGAADYRDRQAEVDAGLEDPDWAWPLRGADEAYLSATTSADRARGAGVPEEQWDEDCEAAFLDAWVRGYEAAHEACAAPFSVTASIPTPSTCLPPGERRDGDRGPMDLDVDLELEGQTLSGEITMVPDPQTGGWRPYGDSPDTWVDGRLLSRIRHRQDLREILDAMIEAAREVLP